MRAPHSRPCTSLRWMPDRAACGAPPPAQPHRPRTEQIPNPSNGWSTRAGTSPAPTAPSIRIRSLGPRTEQIPDPSNGWRTRAGTSPAPTVPSIRIRSLGPRTEQIPDPSNGWRTRAGTSPAPTVPSIRIRSLGPRTEQIPDPSNGWPTRAGTSPAPTAPSIRIRSLRPNGWLTRRPLWATLVVALTTLVVVRLRATQRLRMVDTGGDKPRPYGAEHPHSFAARPRPGAQGCRLV